MGQILSDGFCFAYLLLFSVLVVRRPDADLLTADLASWALLFLGGLVFGCVVAFALRGRRTLGALIYGARSLGAAAVPFYRTAWGVQTVLVLLVTLILGFWLTEFSFVRLVEADSLRHAFRLFSELASPDWAVLPKAIVKIIESIYIAFMATALAFPFAFVLSFFASRNLSRGRFGFVVYVVLRFIFNFARSVEPVLWAILFSIWVSFGPFAGMLALMVHSVASLAKQYSEIVEGVEDGPIQGIEATGATRFQTVWFAVVPQVVLPFISFTIYRWDTNLRMATILGFVGGGGIGAMLMEYQGQARWPQVGTIIVVIAAVVWLMDAFSAHVRAAAK